jgi:uncharacterized protein YjbI with pentapeptide repeats
VADANFDGAYLTDATMSAIALARASCRGSILVRTDFSTSGLTETRFVEVGHRTALPSARWPLMERAWTS